MEMFAMLAIFVFAATAALSLPDQTDIPDGFSTVTCPTIEAAERMFNDYHMVKPAPNDHTVNVELFFEGLAATGCTQASGPIAIDTVTARKALVIAGRPERYIRYIGRDVKGATVHGIVNEDGNNGYHRTALAEWLGQRSADGWLDARGSSEEGWTFQRCATLAEARAVVSSLSGITDEKRFREALSKALVRAKCRPASDRYFVLGKFEEASIECGDECFIDLTALEARDRSGQTIGLVFDGSLM